ncbi:MAG: lysozyme inhibitor LprI family protein [Sphingomonadaceae bacterium]
MADALFDSCAERGKNNADFQACGSALVKRREAALNTEWSARFAGLDPKVKPLLLAEQRLWIAWKDKSCLSWTSGAYGTIGTSIEFYRCRAQVLDDRINTIVGLSEYGEP